MSTLAASGLGSCESLILRDVHRETPWAVLIPRVVLSQVLQFFEARTQADCLRACRDRVALAGRTPRRLRMIRRDSPGTI